MTDPRETIARLQERLLEVVSYSEAIPIARSALDGWEASLNRIKELEPMTAMTTLAEYEKQRDRADRAEARVKELEAALGPR